ncbi:MAG: hypothetical protein M3Z08_06370 [Chloroflexota bacterium]|nr:hypothetical protein [Chloroflexota bacterium]
MLEQIVLETAGFRFSFDIDYNWTDQEYMGMIVTLQMLPPLRDLTLRSERSSIAVSDLRELQTYIEQHMVKIGETTDYIESDVFLNWELGFKIHALSGEVEPSGDGMFSIICSVNIGKTSDGSRVYLGGESGVTFEQARAFLQDIQTFLDQLPELPAELIFGEPATEDGER